MTVFSNDVVTDDFTARFTMALMTPLGEAGDRKLSHASPRLHSSGYGTTLCSLDM
jgi:hypothetical protein